MSIEETGKLLQSNQHEFVDIREALSQKYGWDEKDARITIFNKCSNVCSSVLLGYVFIDKYLSKEEWWKANSTLEINRNGMQNTGNEFEMFLRISLLQNIIYAVESSFRIYVVFLDAQACSNGLAEFKSIYDWLLKRTSLQKYVALLDLLRNIRNTMHNNGLYLPISRKDIVIEYKGKRFEFRVGHPNDFVNSTFIVELIADVRTLLKELVESDEIKKPAFISETS